jgi:hypothetical protein
MTCVTVKEQIPAAIHGGGGFFSPGVSNHVEVCLQLGLPLDRPLINTAVSGPRGLEASVSARLR